MSIAKIFGLLSALAGAGGTLLLFFGSFSYEGFQPYHNQQTIAAQVERNKRRQLLQRWGLGFLLLSFVLAFFSVLFG
jgi:hypothetical protein